ncbi:MAG: PA4642 family protein [Gammaproteobacteria bacterium]
MLPVRKDKKKVVDEVWTPERVRSFLELLPPDGIDPDFHRLRRAYQSMRPEDFEDFVQMFVEAGGNLQARGPEGETLLEDIRRHAHGAPFAEVLEKAPG